MLNKPRKQAKIIITILVFRMFPHTWNYVKFTFSHDSTNHHMRHLILPFFCVNTRLMFRFFLEEFTLFLLFRMSLNLARCYRKGDSKAIEKRSIFKMHFTISDVQIYINIRASWNILCITVYLDSGKTV